METSKAMESKRIAISFMRYSYILITGIFVFINCYLAATGFIAEENRTSDYSKFIPFLIFVVGFIFQFYNKTKMLGFLLVSLPFIYWIAKFL
ncbi:hypothetical protein KUV80_09660 [Fictibacillus nanhaiensis]|uniref:hypothetical protein n=1 Tax=Fictibacillus nanhaiensis TaxID=742169 RepID=UPI001C980536|nr:hypothetical protein [Fictibacillus nanhaiensis]MBY6036921.1 hypothetical protein [Fictibacillus nanhaiensis]